MHASLSVNATLDQLCGGQSDFNTISPLIMLTRKCAISGIPVTASIPYVSILYSDPVV